MKNNNPKTIKMLNLYNLKINRKSTSPNEIITEYATSIFLSLPFPPKIRLNNETRKEQIENRKIYNVIKKTRTPKGPMSLGLKKSNKDRSTIKDIKHKTNTKCLRIISLYHIIPTRKHS